MKKIIYALYDYYLKSIYTKDIAYFSSIIIIVLIIYINLSVVSFMLFQEELIGLLFSNQPRNVPSNGKLEDYWKITLFFVPSCLFFYLLYPEKKIKKLKYTPSELKRIRLILLFYYIFSAILLAWVIKINS
ncbi:hypothetical protein ACQ1PL_05905 [Ornithobacterium rhinotracheale]